MTVKFKNGWWHLYCRWCSREPGRYLNETEASCDAEEQGWVLVERDHYLCPRCQSLIDAAMREEARGQVNG